MCLSTENSNDHRKLKFVSNDSFLIERDKAIFHCRHLHK